MPLYIKQGFLTGRFHATRWRQNAFEDPYGEWPPSPWRLLRALAARWFQYSRETGDENDSLRREIFAALSSETLHFHLPAQAWRGVLKQYHPADLAWSDPKKGVPAVRQPRRTLVADTYWCLSPQDPIFWIWPNLELNADQTELLDQLCRRILYFGRAESVCRLQVLQWLPVGVQVNSVSSEIQRNYSSPVLSFDAKFDEPALLAITDSRLLRNRSVPPSTIWRYYQLPPPIRSSAPPPHTPTRTYWRFAQFAVGGNVYPSIESWTTVTARFRGAALADAGRRVAAQEMDADFSLFLGKDASGRPLQGHQHPYFLIWPDESGAPTRLIVWRDAPFSATEFECLIMAGRKGIGWRNRWDEEAWRLQFVPLPDTTPAPGSLVGPGRVWESVTPFVPPAQRHRFRKNGKERATEAPEEIAARLLRMTGKPTPVRIERLVEQASTWVRLHHDQQRREQLRNTGTPFVRPGFALRIEFGETVAGPIAIGDSAHFGLGLFKTVA